MGDFVSKEELLKSSRKEVVCSSGRKYEIRKISPVDFLEIMGDLPDLSQLTKDPKNVKPKDIEGTKDLMKRMDLLCCRAITSLSVFPDEPNGEGDISVKDIPQEDKTEIVNACLKFSGLSKEEAEKLDPLSETTPS